jgi:SWI/SNF-related matrix-associated actin-dependent regulator of chromatin subfamily A3
MLQRPPAKRSRHQKTALSFMMQRENGPIPKEYRLWNPAEENGVQWYVFGRHLCMLSLTPLVATVILSQTHGVRSSSTLSKSQNILTSLKALVEPNETGGGILADEMGMGKTLSILALVLRTLGAAHNWVRQVDAANETALGMGRYRHRSAATLIVASSDRKSYMPLMMFISLRLFAQS